MVSGNSSSSRKALRLMRRRSPKRARHMSARSQYLTRGYVPLSGVEQNVAGTGWYRRKADFEHSGRLFICFGAVDYRADVYINGVHAGAHQGGYSYFELEITDLWHAGEKHS